MRENRQSACESRTTHVRRSDHTHTHTKSSAHRGVWGFSLKFFLRFTLPIHLNACAPRVNINIGMYMRTRFVAIRSIFFGRFFLNDVALWLVCGSERERHSRHSSTCSHRIRTNRPCGVDMCSTIKSTVRSRILFNLGKICECVSVCVFLLCSHSVCVCVDRNSHIYTSCARDRARVLVLCRSPVLYRAVLQSRRRKPGRKSAIGTKSKVFYVFTRSDHFPTGLFVYKPNMIIF